MTINKAALSAAMLCALAGGCTIPHQRPSKNLNEAKSVGGENN